MPRSLMTSRASPHTRGWTRGGRRAAADPHGFPAHAGMDPPTPPRPRRYRGLPRTRGDGPVGVLGTFYVIAASPHTRGWTWTSSDAMPTTTGFPAHAGMDPPVGATSGCRRRLPRTRGDGPRRCGRGMDLVRRAARRGVLRLPRTRGDGPEVELSASNLREASPHTRGWTLVMCCAPPRARGFPAHAGMDRPRPPSPARSTRLPRTRGDGPKEKYSNRKAEWASPHTRGWTRLPRHRAPGQHGFPALSRDRGN